MKLTNALTCSRFFIALKVVLKDFRRDNNLPLSWPGQSFCEHTWKVYKTDDVQIIGFFYVEFNVVMRSYGLGK